MQPLNQNTFNKVASFDDHLHRCSPMHSTAHRNIPKATDLRLESEVLQPLWEFQCSFVCLAPSPMWYFMYYYYVKYGMHLRRSSFQTYFIIRLIKIRFVIIIIQLLQVGKVHLLLCCSVINSSICALHLGNKPWQNRELHIRCCATSS